MSRDIIDPVHVILVIEDDPVVFWVIRDALAGMPVEVLSASDGESGLDLVGEVQPSLVLLDLGLPEMNGWEVIAHIREAADQNDLPVVIVTGHGDFTNAVDARRLGANGFITKPFHPADLRRVVDQHIGGAAAEAV
jgi:DNA-binding response OmpR family regulator